MYAVVAGGGQVGTHEAVAGRGTYAAPAAADLHLEFDHPLRLLTWVVGERYGEADGEAPDLRGAGLDSGGRDVGQMTERAAWSRSSDPGR
jgi:hypothetical protein